jgi:hypothetical protein
MSIKLTRFYLDFDEECRTGCTTNLAFIDVDTGEADETEADLKEQNVSYIRVDL